jgi:hypothetical protein
MIKSLYARSPSTQESIPFLLVRRPRITSRSAEGAFFFNFGGHNAIINTLALSVNSEGCISPAVCVSSFILLNVDLGDER